MELKAGSQNSLILDYLLGGGTLTGLEAVQKFDCMRLGARVPEINEYLLTAWPGLQVVPETVFVIGPGGKRKRVARYKLVEIF